MDQPTRDPSRPVRSKRGPQQWDGGGVGAVPERDRTALTARQLPPPVPLLKQLEIRVTSVDVRGRSERGEASPRARSTEPALGPSISGPHFPR